MYSKLLDYSENAFERNVEYQKHEFELFIIEIVENKTYSMYEQLEVAYRRTIH
jgi:hypothetical protein